MPGPLDIDRASTHLSVSWSGRGTLQSAPAATGPWAEVLEASNPFSVTNTDAQRYFRAISRYGTNAPLLEANSEMGVAELNGLIYVLGGYPSSRVTVRTVQVYDPALDRWHLTTPLPLPINHPMPGVANGRLYMIGGQTNANNTGSFINTVFEYDPVTSNWATRAPMPTFRSAGAAAVIGPLIYVAGGRPPQGQDFAVYDVMANRWTTLPNLPTPRNHVAAAAIDGKIYVAGGRFGAGFGSEITDVLEVYDPATGLWSTRAPMPTKRSGVNGIAVDGCFFVFGGEGPDGIFEQMEMYVASSDRWYRLEPLAVPVHGVTGAAYVNGFIHLPGGGTAQGGSSGTRLHQTFWVGGLGP